MRFFSSFAAVCLAATIAAADGPAAPASGSAGPGGETTDFSSADPQVLSALKEAEIDYTVDGDGDFVVKYDCPDNRSHIVFINSRPSVLGPFRFRKIWAPAFVVKEPLAESRLNRLLSENASFLAGFWSISPFKGDRLVVFTIPVPCDASGEVLDTALRAAVQAADGLEDLWTNGKDDF